MKMTRNYFVRGLLWVGLYVFFSLAPLFLLLVGPVPTGREFWREFSVALAFAGTALMMLQFALTARIRPVKEPYGSDVVYFFHHKISLVAFGLILSHPLLLFLGNPRLLSLLNVFTASWRARAGVAGLTALIVLVVAASKRQQLKIEYNTWRIWHGILGIGAVVLGLTHAFMVGHYLNVPWKRGLWLAYLIAWLLVLLYYYVLKPLLLMRKPYEIVKITAERGNTWTVSMRPVGHSGLQFMPGQFAWITVRGTPFSKTENPFSISSSAEHPEEISFTIKELGDFTRTVSSLRPGEKAYVDGAYGSFGIDRQDHASIFVFIAGGVGITPMMSMLRTLADRNDSRPVQLIYANRDWDGITFREEIEALKQRLNLSVFYVLEKPPADWQGETGFITRAFLQRILSAERQRNFQEIFLCGPKPMMDAVEKALLQLEFSPDDIHAERFSLA